MSSRQHSRDCAWARFLGITAAIALLAALTLLRDLPTVQADPVPPRLTSRVRPAAAAAALLAVGQEVKTEAGQRRRFALADGSLVYVNERTSLKLDEARRVALQAGEIFVEMAGDVPLVVKTAHREMTGQATQFGVQARGDGTSIVVARGRLSVAGLAAPLPAGQQLTSGSGKPSDAGRVSRWVDWTRDLMNDTPLVPASPHAGGTITAVDPTGQEANLSLRKYHVDVHIEDGFARTTIDQTYFNHEAQRLEGTFHFPLPADASLSRLAMYVDGKRMEGGMTERDHARSVYESIVYRQKDPALLEWVDGTTFKMRVFPLEARQEKRIILSYTQKLPALYGQLQYRFPAGHSLGEVRDWSARVRVKHGADMSWSCASHTLQARKDAGDLLLTAAENNVKLQRDLVLFITESQVAEESRFSAAELDGGQYLMVRCRPALSGQAERQRRDWVFLCETSADREPLLARTQIELVRSLLQRAEPDDTFMVVAANTQLRTMGENGWLTPGPQLRPVTAANIQAAVDFLENAHLIGALDLGRALREIEPYLKAARNPHLVHLGSGIAALGERRDDILAKQIPDGVRYVGVGVGRRWSRSFMKAAAERTGGYVTQVNPDEPVSWRAFELAATLDTPRLLNVQVADPAGKVKFLVHAGMLSQGEEICALARADGPLPEAVVVTGMLGKEPWRQILPVQNVRRGAAHLPRTWAKLEIDRLLGNISRDPKAIKERVIELSKQMYVMTPFTSLLVLENEAMYAQYKVDRGRKDHWAMYSCADKVPVVYEPLPGMPATVKEQVAKPKPTPAQVLHSIQMRGRGQDRIPLFKVETLIPGMQRGRLQDRGHYPSFENVIAGQDRAHSLSIESMAVGLNDSEDRASGKSFQYAIPPYGGFPGPDAFGIGSVAAVPGQSLNALTSDLYVPLPMRAGEVFIVGDSLQRSQVIRRQRLASDSAHEWERILVTLEEARTGSLLFGAGINSDAGVTGSLVTNESSARDWREALLYRRPSHSENQAAFSDLASYAPGMSVTATDIRAVINGEAAPDLRSLPGKIDPAARQLIEQARTANWRSFDMEPGWTILFDGTGRYRWERTLFAGLREQVICDGQTLWHLYPDLGIGARRAVSRFHQADFARLAPWVLAKPEDVARGMDLLSVDARTVAVVPAGIDALKDAKGKPAPYRRLHLVFDSGRLVERQVVEMPAKKVVARQTLSADGSIRTSDADGKELEVRKSRLVTAQPPSLQPDTNQLVVLPLPYRTPEHVRQGLADRQINLEDRPAEEALPLFAAQFAKGDADEAFKVFQTHFHGRNQRQLGFYVLLAACGHNLADEPADVLAEHPGAPLAQYLAVYSSPVLRKHASQWAVAVGQWDDGFLKDMAVAHALLQRWQNPRPLTVAERDQAVEYVRKNQGTLFAWSLLTLMQDRTQKDLVFVRFTTLAELFGLFGKTPGLAYSARYEQARCLWNGRQHDQARERFHALYTDAVQDGTLPRLDSQFRAALLDGKAGASWGEVIRASAVRLIKEKRRLPVLLLAWQCWELDDAPLANHLLQMALDGVTDEKERFDLTLAAIGFLKNTGQLPRADQLLAGLLANPKHASTPALWRLGAELAEAREMTARALHCLEQALAAEYGRLPETIHVQSVRGDYRRLLEHYENLAEAMVSLGVAPPADFLARVVSAGDRWRALDSDADDACQRTAKILRTLGRRELAWDYLTSPIGMKPSDAAPWSSLAGTLQRQGELDLADRAFAAAFDMEPTNAQYLWDRAQNLRQAGKGTEAQTLLKQLAEGQWQPRFEWLKTQARWQIVEK